MAKTNFRPESDGFWFDNSWVYDESEQQMILQEVNNILPMVEGVLSPLLLAIGSPVFLAELSVPFIGPYLVYETIKDINEGITDSIRSALNAKPYGRCGGMAFTAMDYWIKSWVIPCGNDNNDHPTHNTLTGSALRDYIWNRLLDSIRDNAMTFLTWMGIYHFDFVSGGNWLKEQTFNEVIKLKKSIDVGMPVTIGLVGTAWNPFENHQVLAYGYDDNSESTCTLYIYDNSNPKCEYTIKLDFSGNSLISTEMVSGTQISNNARGPLQGLFCTQYYPAVPPQTIVMKDDITAVPPGGQANTPINVNYSIKNIGYHTSPPLILGCCDEKGHHVNNSITEILQEEGDTDFLNSIPFQQTGTHKIFACAIIPNSNYTQNFKTFPPVNSVTVQIYNPRYIDIISYGIGCVTEFAVNTTAIFSTDVSDMPPGVSFGWVIIGGSILGSATGQTLSVKLPPDINTPCYVRVIVKTTDNIYTSGNTGWFQCISAEDAAAKEAACIFKIKSSKLLEYNSFYFKDIPDPAPELKEYLKIDEIITIRDSAQRVVETLTVLVDKGNLLEL